MNASQLYRYFASTSARFGILTNGVDYRFFSDLNEPNKMDPTPFLEVNLNDITDPDTKTLKRFSRESFDLDDTLKTALNLKYTTAIKSVLQHQLSQPDGEFVLFLLRREMRDMRQDLREEIQGLRRETRQDIRDMRNHMGRIDSHIAELRERMGQVEGLLKGLRDAFLRRTASQEGRRPCRPLEGGLSGARCSITRIVKGGLPSLLALLKNGA